MEIKTELYGTISADQNADSQEALVYMDWDNLFANIVLH